jgi:single-strand DNA-binding protein
MEILMVNKVILIGNLTRDPEIRATQQGKEIANISMATNETWKDKATGERKEKVEFHNVVIFNEGLVNVVKNYVKKGSKLYVEGSLCTRKWTDKNGNDKYTTEVVLQGFNSTLQMLNKVEGAPQNKPPQDNFTDSELDDTIPF